MASQRALAPPVRRADQLDHLIELDERFMADKTDTIERHLDRLRYAFMTGVPPL